MELLRRPMAFIQLDGLDLLYLELWSTSSVYSVDG